MDGDFRPTADAIERAAKVLCGTSANGGDPDGLDAQGIPNWHSFRDAATAQLTALQEQRRSSR